MKGEIDKVFYCSAGCYENGGKCTVAGVCLSDCDNRHRKHPTPEQFKEEYGEDYHDDWAVYSRNHNILLRTDQKEDGSFENIYKYSEWVAMPYSEFKYILTQYDVEIREEFQVVCACTPWGKPPRDWRPE